MTVTPSPEAEHCLSTFVEKLRHHYVRICLDLEDDFFVSAIKQLAVQSDLQLRNAPVIWISGNRDKLAIVPDVAANSARRSAARKIPRRERLVYVDVLDFLVQHILLGLSSHCNTLYRYLDVWDLGSADKAIDPKGSSVHVGHDYADHWIVIVSRMSRVDHRIDVRRNVPSHVRGLVSLFPQLIMHHLDSDQGCAKTRPATKGANPVAKAIGVLVPTRDRGYRAGADDPNENPSKQKVGHCPTHQVGIVLFSIAHKVWPLSSCFAQHVFHSGSMMQWGRG